LVYDYKSKEYLESAFCLIRFSVSSIKTHQNHCLFVNLFYLCNRKSLEKVAEPYKKSLEKRAQIKQKSLEKRAQISLQLSQTIKYQMFKRKIEKYLKES